MPPPREGGSGWAHTMVVSTNEGGAPGRVTESGERQNICSEQRHQKNRPPRPSVSTLGLEVAGIPAGWVV